MTPNAGSRAPSRSGGLAEEDAETQTGYATALREQADWEPVPGAFHLFWVDLAEVTFIRYERATGDQFVTLWPAGREFVRRGATPTSLGAPQEYAGLLSGT
jgi:hypothetical protein